MVLLGVRFLSNIIHKSELSYTNQIHILCVFERIGNECIGLGIYLVKMEV